jgi:protein ImuB
MRRREAEAVCPTILTVTVDPGAEAIRFEPVVLAIESLVPRIEVGLPGLIFAPVGGAVRYYGGEEPLVAELLEVLEATAGPGYRVGLAAGPFAARRAADFATAAVPCHVVDDDEAFRSQLDISVLGKEELAATFRWLGITTLGSLANLPRPAVVSRFGNEGLVAHRLARGDDRVPQPRTIPEDITVLERFDPPLDNIEQAAFAARSLAHQLIADLAEQGVAPHRVEIEATAANGTIRARTWRSADPFDETMLADRVRWQMRAWLDHARVGGTGIHGGLTVLKLAPTDVSGEGRQYTLHEDVHSAAEAERSLAQAQALLGPDHVLRALPQGGRSPGERVAWYRWGEEATTPPRDPAAPWPGAIPAPSPALVPPEPVPLAVEWDDGMPVRVRLGSRWVPVLSWAGPWRNSGRWWEGETPADRYQLVTSAGAILCEVREATVTMTGVYD